MAQDDKRDDKGKQRGEKPVLRVQEYDIGSPKEAGGGKFKADVTATIYYGKWPAQNAIFQFVVDGKTVGDTEPLNPEGKADGELTLKGEKVSISISVALKNDPSSRRLLFLKKVSLPKLKRKLVFLRGFKRPNDIYEVYLRPLGKDGNFVYQHAEYWDFNDEGQWGHWPAEADLRNQVVRVSLPMLDTSRTVEFVLRNDAEAKVHVQVPAKETKETQKPAEEPKVDYAEKGRNAFRRLLGIDREQEGGEENDQL